MLTFEAIVVLLALPVALNDEGVSTAVAVAVFVGLGVACLVVAALLRRSWGYPLGWALQVAVVATALLVPLMLVLGLVFGALWWAALHYGARVDAVRAQRSQPG